MPDTFTFTLTQEEIVLVARALGSMPWGQINSLMLKMQSQIDAQQSKPSEAGNGRESVNVGA